MTEEYRQVQFNLLIHPGFRHLGWKQSDPPKTGYILQLNQLIHPGFIHLVGNSPTRQKPVTSWTGEGTSASGKLPN
jgi:hypothetical protein